jgi:hypothetical protein
MLDCSVDKVDVVFTDFLQRVTTLVIRKEKAKSVGCRKFNDEVEVRMGQLCQRIAEYIENPNSNYGIHSRMSTVIAELSSEAERLRNAEKTQRKKKKKKSGDDGDGNVGELLLGAGMGLQWSTIGSFNSIVDITEDDMEYFADLIYQHGWMSLEVVKARGYLPRGKKQKSWTHLLDRALSALPVFAIRQNKSRYVTILIWMRSGHLMF